MCGLLPLAGLFAAGLLASFGTIFGLLAGGLAGGLAAGVLWGLFALSGLVALAQGVAAFGAAGAALGWKGLPVLSHLCGDLEQAVDVGEDLAALIPGARFEVMTDCGHWPQFEDADTFNKLHIEFLLGE